MTATNRPPVVYIDMPRHPALQALHKYWLSKCGARRMPARADINPADIKPLLPDVMIWSAVEPYLVRLAGDNVVRFVGRNYTGTPATEGMPPDAARGMNEVFRLVIETKTPRFRIGNTYWLAEKWANE